MKVRYGWLSILCLVLSVPLAWRLLHRRSAQLDRMATRFAAWHLALPEVVDDTWLLGFASGQHGLGKTIAAVVQRQDPDVLLLTGLPRGAAGEVARILRGQYFGERQEDAPPVAFPHLFVSGPAGRMAVFARFPILADGVREFAALPWRALPGARATAEAGDVSLWGGGCAVVPLQIEAAGAAVLVNLVCAAPSASGTPLVDAGHHADALRTLQMLVAGEELPWLVDDRGRAGGLSVGAPVVLLGPLGCDPVDGPAEVRAAMAALLASAVQDPLPTSAGAAEAHQLQWGANAGQRGDPACDTADLDDAVGAGLGNLRLDYALPGRAFEVVGSGVFWPGERAGLGSLLQVAPHRLVWVDVRIVR